MLCFVPPVFRAPEYPPLSSAPEVGGGAAALIIMCIAFVGLVTPVGWSRSQPEYELRVGVASRLGPRPIERELMSRLDGAKTVASVPPASGAARATGQAGHPVTFFARHEAYDAVPPGLTVDSATGALVGVPTMAGSYTVAVGVTDGTTKHAVTGPSFRVKILPAL